MVSRYDANFAKQQQQKRRSKKDEPEFKIPDVPEGDVVEVSTQAKSEPELNLPKEEIPQEEKKLPADDKNLRRKIDVVI